MAEESDQPQQTTSSQPAPAPQNPQHSGQRGNDRRDRGRGRHPGGQRQHTRRGPRLEQGTPAPTTEPAGKATDIDDEEEPEHDRSSSQRRHFRGGRPPKKIIEEWANDIYCE
ncbi:MAG: hypothetical protein PHT99_01470 [Methanoregula sp.]|nr:hypothetical protein [Methanoregula sp.]